MELTLFTSSFAQALLVFVLVFALIFAILQKTKLLGEGKAQIDALVGGAAALLVLSAGYALEIIQQLIPFLAVSLVIILVFLLLAGFFWEKFEVPGWMKTTAFALAFVAVIIAVLNFTGGYDRLEAFFSNWSSLWSNILVLVIVGVAVAVALSSGGSATSNNGK